MIRPINTSTVLLSLKSKPADELDAQVGRDLLDTLDAHRHECVGMAANMIGVPKRIIVVAAQDGPLLMYNPVITKASGPYRAEEGCLSIPGVREVRRHRVIDVEYLDGDFKQRKRTFTGITAQIIQHEIDHCDGVLV